MPLLQIIIFSLPLYLARFSIFGLKTSILDVFLVIFIIWQFVNLKHRTRLLLRQLADRNDNTYIFPIVLIIIGATISTINSSDVVRSLGILKSYFVLPILFFFTASSIVKTQEQKEKILISLFLGGFIISVVGIFYWLTGELTYDGRLRAFFESPNQLAMFLAPAVIAGIHLLQTQDSRLKTQDYNPKLKTVNILYITAILLIGIVILFTQSLGAIAATLIAVLPFFYRQIKNHINKIIVFLILLSLVFSFLFLVFKKDFSERSSLSSRVMIWQSAGAILKDNWLWGIGPGTFQEKYLEYQKYFPPYLEWASPQPHNIFLAFWLQTGIIGFAGFLWLIFIFFKNVRQNKNNDIVFLSGILMIYTLIHGLIDTTYWRNDLAVMFWLIVLLSLNLNSIKSLEQRD